MQIPENRRYFTRVQIVRISEKGRWPRLVAPHVSRMSAEGTMRSEISRMTLVLFLCCIFRQVVLKRSSRIKELTASPGLRPGAFEYCVFAGVCDPQIRLVQP